MMKKELPEYKNGDVSFTNESTLYWDGSFRWDSIRISKEFSLNSTRMNVSCSPETGIAGTLSVRCNINTEQFNNWRMQSIEQIIWFTWNYSSWLHSLVIKFKLSNWESNINDSNIVSSDTYFWPQRKPPILCGFKVKRPVCNFPVERIDSYWSTEPTDLTHWKES